MKTRSYGLISNIDKIELQKIANDCFSVSDLIRKLGYSAVAGGTFGVVKKYLKLHQINTEHWTGRAWSRGQQLKDWGTYTSLGRVKKHLIEKRTHKCELCCCGEWRNQPIPLEVHHIDGNRVNNDYNNLQLLCPNCHALTDNWRGRNISKARNVVSAKKQKISIPCTRCGESTANKKYCSSDCYHKSNLGGSKIESRKVERPQIEQLLKEISETNYCAVGRKYGVSDNAIRKWVKPAN